MHKSRCSYWSSERLSTAFSIALRSSAIVAGRILIAFCTWTANICRFKLACTANASGTSRFCTASCQRLFISGSTASSNTMSARLPMLSGARNGACCGIVDDSEMFSITVVTTLVGWTGILVEQHSLDTSSSSVAIALAVSESATAWGVIFVGGAIFRSAVSCSLGCFLLRGCWLLADVVFTGAWRSSAFARTILVSSSLRRWSSCAWVILSF